MLCIAIVLIMSVGNQRRNEMNDFWNWMIKKKCAKRYTNPLYYELIDEFGNPSVQNKQMLIGYMIEYLFFMGYDCDVLSEMKYNTHDIDDFYNYLVNIIEEK